MKKLKLISAITSTGEMHIGHYFSVIKPIIKLQNDYEIILFVANLHALTTDNVHQSILQHQTQTIINYYLACGIDSTKVKIFIQSHIPEISELHYLLSCHTTVGQLNNMTQYKDKKIKHANQSIAIPTGILIYPILMSADILLFDSDVVLTGIDQTQHIEFIRNLAEKINHKFNTTVFTLPTRLQAFDNQLSDKIMSLQNPLKKMSKSDDNEFSKLNLADKPDIIKQKIMKAITDTENKIYFDPINKPGVSNLLKIFCLFSETTIKDAEDIFQHKNYHDLKNTLIDIINDAFKNIQDRTKLYQANNEVLKTIITNEKQIKTIAKQKMKFIKKI